MMSVRRVLNRSILFSTALSLMPVALHAGQLTPPSSPAPTFKTLNEVKPGVPISQDDIPFLIAENGVYYLTSDIIAPLGTMEIITVANRINHVTIDLGGFSITAHPDETNPSTAIRADSPATEANLSVRNGTINDINGPAIHADDWSLLVEDVTVRGTQTYGISGGDHSVVRRSNISSISGTSTLGDAKAIALGDFSTVRDSSITTVVANGLDGEARGIQVGDGSLVEDNILRSIRGSSSSAADSVVGIDASLQSRVANNTLARIGGSADGGLPPSTATAAGIAASAASIVGNTIEDIVAGVEAYGIVGVASNIRDNHVRAFFKAGNSGPGHAIYAIGESVVIGNTLSNIRASPVGGQDFSGIYIIGRALVKDNHIYGDFRDQQESNRIAGILIDGQSSIVRRNTVLPQGLGGISNLGNAIILGPNTEGNIVLGNQFRGSLTDVSMANYTDDPGEPNISF